MSGKCDVEGMGNKIKLSHTAKSCTYNVESIPHDVTM